MFCMKGILTGFLNFDVNKAGLDMFKNKFHLLISGAVPLRDYKGEIAFGQLQKILKLPLVRHVLTF